MNVLFLSPQYPPNFVLFCARLAQRGARVLGLGDAPPEALEPALRRALAEYRFVHDLEDRAQVLAAARELERRHGPLGAIESHNEHWLPLEAWLRDALGVPGPSEARVRELQRKSSQARVLEAHGLPAPAGHRVEDREGLEAFARAHGYPLFFKPDVGVGADGAFRVEDAAGLAPLLASPPRGFLVQPFLPGRLTSFDGLAGRDGEVLFAASLLYTDTVFDIRREGREVFFYTRREVPAALAALGRAVLRACDVRSRFFHLEFFEDAAGALLPLEVNLRPPGGYCLDLMNFSADIDLYDLWARVLLGEEVPAVATAGRYFAAHVGRRPRPYRLPATSVAAALGGGFLAAPRVPEGLRLMGDPIFLLRHAEEAEVQRLARLVLEGG